MRMDLRKRIAEIATVVCGALAIYELVMLATGSGIGANGTLAALCGLLLAAAILNFAALRRKPVASPPPLGAPVGAQPVTAPVSALAPPPPPPPPPEEKRPSKKQELVAQIERLESRVRKLNSEEHRKLWQEVGVLRQCADFADMLSGQLEGIWQRWRDSGGKLLYPLHSSAVPEGDKPLSPNVRRLLEFRILYRQHIAEVGKADPQFRSKLMDEGFPCDVAGQDYLAVKRKLEEQASLLRQRADDLAQAFLTAAEQEN